ncbi:MAG: TIGR02452 family protein, partial [Polyangiaceae bacterium]
TTETTAQAARRLAEREGELGAVALNFASAKNPGGGFLGGAKAQEEDLARCSALYECLLTQRAYYDANRSLGSALYTDHMIYSPDVPFFRNERLELLETPFLVSILTAPAPNAGAVWKNHPEDGPQIRTTLDDRAKKLLAVAADRGHRCLILGAWGCGAFHNDPSHVAEAFAVHLASPAFAGAFERVIFPIYERGSERKNLAAFRERLG